MTKLSEKVCFFLIVTAIMFCSWNAYGQIAMKISLPRKNYLLYEPVYIRLDLRNVSGHPIVFGEAKDLAGKLDFEIRSQQSSSYIPLSGTKTPSPKGIVLKPGVIKSFTCNLTQFYKLYNQGQYTVRAVISHPRMKRSYRSNDLSFTVTEGKLIWESIVGIPEDISGSRDKNDIRTRKYSVLSYSNGRNGMYVLRIEDSRKIYSLRHLGYNLGNMLLPQCAVDNLSRVHILIAGSHKVFSYYVFDVNGKLVSSEVRLKTRTVPRLAINRELGTIVLTGGRKALKDKDYEEIRNVPFIKGIFENKNRPIRPRSSTLFDDVDEPASPASGGNTAPAK